VCEKWGEVNELSRENVLLMINPISSHSSVYFRLFFYKDLDTGEADMEGGMDVELPVAMR